METTTSESASSPLVASRDTLTDQSGRARKRDRSRTRRALPRRPYPAIVRAALSRYGLVIDSAPVLERVAQRGSAGMRYPIGRDLARIWAAWIGSLAQTLRWYCSLPILISPRDMWWVAGRREQPPFVPYQGGFGGLDRLMF